ncbi:MAG: monovalent cation/H(+) antiporter subunit G [candidate division KSB1 bacterium]|nr:monovalent cation/H(+) antiporter subunit G [candidate division KSB1 bacterium]
MKETFSAALIIIGTIFTVLAAIGILRMPDVFQRLSTATKAATLGVGSLLLAAAVHFDNLGTTTRALATIFFLILTAPIAAHIIGRAAYFIGTPLWEGTICDELAGRYNAQTHVLESPEENSRQA